METSESPSKLEKLRAEYNELTGKKPGPKWDEATLQQKIFEFKTSGDDPAPKVPKTVSLEVRGNMTENLEGNHPQFNYTFENKLAVKGSRISRPLYLSDYYHLHIVPAVWMGDHKSPTPKQSPYITRLSPQEWRDSSRFYTKAQNMIVTILHDPTRN